MSSFKNNIIFCATQRSGSSMICNRFKMHGVGNAKEHLLPFIRKIRHKEAFDKKKALNKIARKSKLNDVTAVKIMANYLHYADYISDSESSDWESYVSKLNLEFPSFYKLFKESHWIFIQRNNKIRQAMSRITARKTKVYHSYQIKSEKTGNYDNEINISENEILKEVSKISTENSLWYDFFTRNKINYTSIIYEDVVSNKDYIPSIMAELNLPVTTPDDSEIFSKLSNESTEEKYNKLLDSLFQKIKVR